MRGRILTTLLLTTAACSSSGAPYLVLSSDPLEVSVALATHPKELAFDRETITVPAGSLVHLTFQNLSVLPGMFHNWVLTEPGTEERVARQAIPAGYESAWVPRDDAVLAATGALRPGEEETVVFTAPARGSYTYLCTVPGHAFEMRGTLVVR